MFGSSFLEVVIGLSFTYLLLSLVCSTVREGIESLTKSRATLLERGIRELLYDRAGTGLAKTLYEHPLIFGLFRGDYLAHRRPDIWPNPARFDPDRFIGLRPSPYAFLPFGGGIRRCLGMAFALYEMKVVLAEVLRRVTLRAAPGHQVRVVRRSITLAPSAGMPVVVDAVAA
jgi:hypothetical protein